MILNFTNYGYYGIGFLLKKEKKTGHIIILTTSKFKKGIGTKIIVKEGRHLLQEIDKR